MLKEVLQNKAFFFTLIYLFLFFLIAKIFPDVFVVISLVFFFIILIEPLANFLRELFRSDVLSKILSVVILLFGFSYAFYLITPIVISEFGNFFNFVMNVLENKLWRNYVKDPSLLFLLDRVIEFFEPRVLGVLDTILSVLASNAIRIVSIVVFTILGLMYGIFYTREIANFFLSMYPKTCRDTMREVLKEVHGGLGRYIRVIFVNSIIVGVAYFVVFRIFNLQYSGIIAFWGFVTNFIPIVGVILELIPVFLFSLSLGLEGLIMMMLFASAIHIVVFLIFLHMMKGLEKLNPLYIIFSILFFGKIFGTFGTFIGVPIALVLKILWKSFVNPLLERH